MAKLWVGLGEDQRQLGVVGHRDEHLGAVDHPPGVGLARAGALVGRVGAGVGLGQAEAAEPFPGAELRQVVLLLLLGAPAQDGRAHQRGLHRDHGAHRRVAAPDLLDDQPVGQVVEPGATVLAGDDRPQVTLVGDLGDQLEVEVLVAIVLAGALDDLVVGEGAGGLADQPLLVGEVEVHGSGTVSHPAITLIGGWLHRRGMRAAAISTSPIRSSATVRWIWCTCRAGSRRSSTTGPSRRWRATSSAWRRSAA